MSTSLIVKTSLAAALMLGTSLVVVSTIAQAQQQQPSIQELAQQPVGDPSTFRAAQEPEQEFADDAAAARADDEDSSQSNRLMIYDANGRPYMYDGVRDGFACRAVRVPVRRVYRRTVRCGFGSYQQGAFLNSQQGGVFPQQQFGFDPGQFRAAQETEETFTDEQGAARADDEDSQHSDRFMIIDGSGRPITYDHNQGYSCRVVRVPSRAVYRRTVRCNMR